LKQIEKNNDPAKPATATITTTKNVQKIESWFRYDSRKTELRHPQFSILFSCFSTAFGKMDQSAVLKNYSQ